MSSLTWRVPGRIEVLGKHTDYAGGRVLVGAIDHGITVRATLGGEGVVASTDAFGDRVRLAAGVDPGLPDGHWARYVQTAIDRLTANFGAIAPCELDITSDLPPASGMSSSSALLCGVALALADLNGFSSTPAWQDACPDRLSLAGYLACIENGRTWRGLAGSRGVGTFGGSEDHTAMLCGSVGELLQVEFDPLRVIESVPLSEDLAFVVAVSGVLAEKTGPARDAYNRASLATASILDLWNERSGRRAATLAAVVRTLAGDAPDPADPTLGVLRRVTGGDAWLSARLEHFLQESYGLVPGATRALASGDWATFGRVSAESQRLAETLLGNQVPQTIALAASARELGAHASSAFGAGFGGSVWALVEANDAYAFSNDWLARYRSEFPDEAGASVLVTRPGSAASRI